MNCGITTEWPLSHTAVRACLSVACCGDLALEGERLYFHLRDQRQPQLEMDRKAMECLSRPYKDIYSFRDLPLPLSFSLCLPIFTSILLFISLSLIFSLSRSLSPSLYLSQVDPYVFKLAGSSTSEESLLS